VFFVFFVVQSFVLKVRSLQRLRCAARATGEGAGRATRAAL